MTELERWRQSFIVYLQQHWTTEDAAHDIHHLHRVWRTCRKLMADESRPVNELVVLAACYFHDFVTVAKDHPDRARASLLSANQAAHILCDKLSFPGDKIAAVYHAIHAHSFSANVPVESIEAAILQDADRMEALGAIGLARMFYTAGKMDSELFDPEDVLAERRPLDDRRYSLDHIEAKLLRLPGTMNTNAGRKMAETEADFLRSFRRKLVQEIEG